MRPRCFLIPEISMPGAGRGQKPLSTKVGVQIPQPLCPGQSALVLAVVADHQLITLTVTSRVFFHAHARPHGPHKSQRLQTQLREPFEVLVQSKAAHLPAQQHNTAAGLGGLSCFIKTSSRQTNQAHIPHPRHIPCQYNYQAYNDHLSSTNKQSYTSVVNTTATKAKDSPRPQDSSGGSPVGFKPCEGGGPRHTHHRVGSTWGTS